MATYLWTDLHKYMYGGSPGSVLCKCGVAGQIATGTHLCLIRGSATATRGWTTCRFCGIHISNSNPGGVGVPAKNPVIYQAVWTAVACSPLCAGYAYNGIDPAPMVGLAPTSPAPVVAVAQRPMPPEELEFRRILIGERLRQVVGIAMALGHDGEKLPSIDIQGTDPLVLICAFCGDTVTMSMKTHPAIAYKGPVVMFRCKKKKA